MFPALPSLPQILHASWYSASGRGCYYLSQTSLVINPTLAKRVALVAIAVPLFTLTASIDFTWQALKIILLSCLLVIALPFIIALFCHDCWRYGPPFGIELRSLLKTCRDTFHFFFDADIIASLALPLLAIGYSLKGRVVPSNRIGSNILQFLTCKTPKLDMCSLNTAITVNDAYTFNRLIAQLPPEELQKKEDNDRAHRTFYHQRGFSTFHRARNQADLGKPFYLRHVLQLGIRPTTQFDLEREVAIACKGRRTETGENDYIALDLIRNSCGITPQQSGVRMPGRDEIQRDGMTRPFTVVELAMSYGSVSVCLKLFKENYVIDTSSLRDFSRTVDAMIQARRVGLFPFDQEEEEKQRFQADPYLVAVHITHTYTPIYRYLENEVCPGLLQLEPVIRKMRVVAQERLETGHFAVLMPKELRTLMLEYWL